MKIDENIMTYCKQHSTPDENILNKLSDYTFKEVEAANMISGNMVGNLLYILSTSINAQRVLDVGMFTGYSALKLASSIPSNGEVHTFELAKNHIKSARKFFSDSKYNNIIIHEGEALGNLETLQAGTFDFAFIDADKINYIEYYKKCMHLLKPKGILVIDNMLWGGSVIKPKDQQSHTIRTLAQIIQKDDRVINTMLPIRDGVMICYKI